MSHICITTPEKKKWDWASQKSNPRSSAFFDSQGIVHTESVPQGQTVNQFYYREILERLRKRAVRVRPNMNPALEDQLQKRITMWRKCEPLHSHCRLMVWIITSELNLNHTTVHQILTQELAMRKLCAKIVPKNLLNEQKDNRKDVSSSSGTDPKWQKFLEERDYRWRNMDLWVRSRNKKTK